MEWLSILAYGGAGGLVMAGYGLMNYLSARGDALRPPTPPEARCSCGHGSGEHSGADGRCGAVQVIRRHTYSSERGTSDWDERTQCWCSSYDGPDPVQLRLLRGA